MLTTHLALISFILGRAAGGAARRQASPLRSLARRIGRALAALRPPSRVHDLPLNNHLRRDIGLDPLRRDPFRG
jgi:hypothetical protein